MALVLLSPQNPTTFSFPIPPLCPPTSACSRIHMASVKDTFQPPSVSAECLFFSNSNNELACLVPNFEDASLYNACAGSLPPRCDKQRTSQQLPYLSLSGRSSPVLLFSPPMPCLRLLSSRCIVSSLLLKPASNPRGDSLRGDVSGMLGGQVPVVRVEQTRDLSLCQQRKDGRR